MSPIDFNLICHPANLPESGIRIDGRIQRRHGLLSITYVLQDPAGLVPIPSQAIPATRSHGLWERTCFECFIAVDNAKDYWEINLSPTGDWNVYRFDDYRLGMRQAAAFETLPVKTDKKGTTLELQCVLDLSPITPARRPIEIGLSAVVQGSAGKNSYWALVHPGPRPDFHHRSGFILML